MEKIKILHDVGDVYEDNSIHGIKEIIDDYVDTCNDKSVITWLYSIPLPTAIEFIADAWGLDYEFV